VVCWGRKSVLALYCDPGVLLAQGIRREIISYLVTGNGQPRIILIQSHGLIALGGSVNAVLIARLMAEKAACIFPSASHVSQPTVLTSEIMDRIGIRTDEQHRQRILKL